MNIYRKSLLLMSLVLGLGACHPNAGDSQSDMMPDGGTTDAGSLTGPAAFLGTWQYVAGTGTTSFVCSDGTTFSGSAQGTETETFTAGAQADELLATDDGGCTATCVVSQDVAMCHSASACMGATISSDVYTLSGGKLSESGVAAQVVLSDGTTCQLSSVDDGVLTRVP